MRCSIGPSWDGFGSYTPETILNDTDLITVKPSGTDFLFIRAITLGSDACGSKGLAGPFAPYTHISSALIDRGCLKVGPSIITAYQIHIIGWGGFMGVISMAL